MIASYIQELLSENNRVIVPGFGAFLVRATSKFKDAKELSKKLNDIYFSPFLKFNDELLVNYITKKEEISKDEAIKKINDFTEVIKNDIEKGEVFEIKDFGVFAIEEGKIQFTPATKSSKPGTKTKTADKEKAPEKKETAPKTPVKETEKTEAKETKGDTAKKSAESKPTEAKQAPAATKQPAKTVQEAASKEPTKTVSKPQPKPAEKKPIHTTPPQKEKKYNRGIILALAIGIPVAILFVLALLNLDTIQDFLSKDTKEKAKTEQVVKKKAPAPKDQTKDTTAKKVTTKTETTAKKQAAQTKQTKLQPRQKKYYIIAGSFQKRSNAQRYMETLQKKGFKAELLPERNGMHAVSYNAFTDKRKAMAELRYLTKEKQLQAWLLYY